MLKKLVATVFIVFFSTAHAADFFDGNKAREVINNQKISADATINGYPVYQGGGDWLHVFSAVSDTNGPAPLNLGTISLIHFNENKKMDAYQIVTANLSQSSSSSGWAGAPCSGEFLYTRARVRGRDDDCLSIKATTENTANNTTTTYLEIKVTQSTSGGRYLVNYLKLNPDFFGHPGTGLGDWTKAMVETNQPRKEYFGRLIEFGHSFQDAVKSALNYSKPLDAFKDVPSISWIKNGKNSTPEAMTPVKTSVFESAKGTNAESRLIQLKQWYEAKLISERDYEAGKKKILEGL